MHNIYGGFLTENQNQVKEVVTLPLIGDKAPSFKAVTT